MELQHTLFEIRDGAAWITINHPERHNAFDYRTIRELGDVLEEVGLMNEVGVIVLTGAGEKAFCAGGFLGDLANFNTKMARQLFGTAGRTLDLMRKVPQPIIAAVNGYAIGGGNELVIASDLAIAVEHATFGQTGPRIGSSPVYGATNLLAMTIGEKRSREVVYLCRQYTAQEALDMGWINRVVPRAELVPEVDRWCRELLEKSPSYLELSKISSNVWWDMLAPAFAHAGQTLLRLAGGEEMTEGASAFMQKRKPDFSRFRQKL